jgi:hypothetical protein
MLSPELLLVQRFDGALSIGQTPTYLRRPRPELITLSVPDRGTGGGSRLTTSSGVGSGSIGPVTRPAVVWGRPSRLPSRIDPLRRLRVSHRPAHSTEPEREYGALIMLAMILMNLEPLAAADRDCLRSRRGKECS